MIRDKYTLLFFLTFFAQDNCLRFNQYVRTYRLKELEQEFGFSIDCRNLDAIRQVTKSHVKAEFRERSFFVFLPDSIARRLSALTLKTMTLNQLQKTTRIFSEYYLIDLRDKIHTFAWLHQKQSYFVCKRSYLQVLDIKLPVLDFSSKFKSQLVLPIDWNESEWRRIGVQRIGLHKFTDSVGTCLFSIVKKGL